MDFSPGDNSIESAWLMLFLLSFKIQY